MPRFAYKVRSSNGDLVSGFVNAASIQDAGQTLRAEGKFVVDIAPARDESDPAPAAGTRGGRIKRADVITFAHQMAVMIDTGVPMSEALHCIAEQAVNQNFKTVLEN